METNKKTKITNIFQLHLRQTSAAVYSFLRASFIRAHNGFHFTAIRIISFAQHTQRNTHFYSLFVVNILDGVLVCVCTVECM